MQEIHLRSHTIQTHGARLARKHTHDWVVLVFLAAVVLDLHYATPFSRFVGKDIMIDIRYLVKPSTVPACAVPIISILCHLVIFASIYIARRDVYDLHHATLGVLFAVLITAVITDVIKNAVGRPRPDIFWRCFPDEKELYDQVTSGVICHGEKSFLKDGRKSFPSGHTSLYLDLDLIVWILMLYVLLLSGRIVVVIVWILMLYGYVMAMPFYLHFFPPYHHQGWGPHAYFHLLEELEASNSNNAENQQSAGAGDHHVGLTGQNQSSTSRNDLELEACNLTPELN